MAAQQVSSQFDIKGTRKYLIIAFLCAVSIFCAFNNYVSQFMTSMTGQSRTVLSKISGNLTGTADMFDVIKVKEDQNILLEIYKKLPEGNVRLIHKINLPHENDGYVLFQNSSVNLALSDLDGDKIPEIIVPTFDKTLSAHLNVIKYSPENNIFFLMLEPLFQNN